MADTKTNTNRNTQEIIGFDIFDGAERIGTGPAAEYPVLARPVGTANLERESDAPSHPPLDVSFFDC